MIVNFIINFHKSLVARNVILDSQQKHVNKAFIRISWVASLILRAFSQENPQ